MLEKRYLYTMFDKKKRNSMTYPICLCILIASMLFLTKGFNQSTFLTYMFLCTLGVSSYYIMSVFKPSDYDLNIPLCEQLTNIILYEITLPLFLYVILLYVSLMIFYY